MIVMEDGYKVVTKRDLEQAKLLACETSMQVPLYHFVVLAKQGERPIVIAFGNNCKRLMDDGWRVVRVYKAGSIVPIGFIERLSKEA